MNNENPFYGVICPLLTPFKDDGTIDERSLYELVERQISAGTHGLLIGGTTGEGMLLSVEERKQLTKMVLSAAKKRIRVFIHTGCMTTADTVDLTEDAVKQGADGISAITPWFFSYTDEELYQFYNKVADASCGLPVAMYVFSGNAKQNVSPELFSRIIDHNPNIVAIKSSNPDLIRFQDYVCLSSDEFAVLNGVDALMLPALSIGSKGQISGNSNVYPEVFINLWNAYQSGNLEMAGKCQKQIRDIRGMFKDQINYFKAAMEIMGMNAGICRAPAGELAPEEKKVLESKMAAFNVKCG